MAKDVEPLIPVLKFCGIGIKRSPRHIRSKPQNSHAMGDIPRRSICNESLEVSSQIVSSTYPEQSVQSKRKYLPEFAVEILPRH